MSTERDAVELRTIHRRSGETALRVNPTRRSRGRRRAAKAFVDTSGPFRHPTRSIHGGRPLDAFIVLGAGLVRHRGARLGRCLLGMRPLRDILRRVPLLGVGLDNGVHRGLHGVLLDHVVDEDDGECLGRRGVRARRPGRVGVDDGVPLLGQAEPEHCIRTRLALGTGGRRRDTSRRCCTSRK